MWPILLDMTKDECKRTLRRLELEAYGSVVSALRAQGGLSSEKHKLLQDVASTLNIPQERHRAEIRRACNDERLATIAHCMTGDDTNDEWALEGRRLVPLMPRLVPQTAYSVIADDEANKTSIDNEKLPLPVNTERKRSLASSGPESGNKNVQFRVPSESITKATVQNTMEDIPMKKRKTNINMEGSSLAQHLMMPQPKISRVQQLYRQKTKALLKSQSKHHRIAPAHSSIQLQPLQMQKQSNLIKQQHHLHQQMQQQQQLQQEEEIVNTLQEVPIPLPKPAQTEQPSRGVNPVTVTSTAVSNENHLPSPQPQPKVKPTVIHSSTVKPVTVQGTSNISVITSMTETPPSQSAQKSIKICPARKIVTSLSSKSPAQPQKVIIVSSSQGSTTSSILQRTLTIPFVKTIAMKNLEKVKVINNPATTVTTNATAPVANSKPKMLTVQTKAKVGGAGKTVSIPFIQGVQLQALQNKGAIKMFPVAKSSKSTILNANSSPVYIMNTNTTLPVVTKSASTPVLSTRAQNKQDGDRNVIIIKNEDMKAATLSDESTNENVVYVNKPVQSNKNECKSSVLAEILKASGVLPAEEPEHCDIESQISQLTQIPTTIGADIEQQIVTTPDASSSMEEEVETTEETDMETFVKEESQDEEHFHETVTTEEMDTSNYVIVHENEDEAQTLMLTEQPHHNEEVVELMGSLDPETGMYSVKTTEEYEISQHDVDSSQQSQTSTESYLVDMESLHNSELDMPSLS